MFCFSSLLVDETFGSLELVDQPPSSLRDLVSSKVVSNPLVSTHVYTRMSKAVGTFTCMQIYPILTEIFRSRE